MSSRIPDLSQRQREADLIRSIGLSNAIEADSIKHLLSMRLEAVKEKLVTADGAYMLRLQGEAQCLKQLYNDLLRVKVESQE